MTCVQKNEFQQPAALYGALHWRGLRVWERWPFRLDCATVASDYELTVRSILVRPPADWPTRGSPDFGPGLSEEQFNGLALEPKEAAHELNRLFGGGAVAINQVHITAISNLYRAANVRQTWTYDDWFFPLKHLDVMLGRHSVINFRCRLPYGAGGREAVHAQAIAFIELHRAHRAVVRCLDPLRSEQP